MRSAQAQRLHTYPSYSFARRDQAPSRLPPLVLVGKMRSTGTGSADVIWKSFWAIAIVDITIVSLVVIMIGVALAKGMFAQGKTPRLGRGLVVAGVVVTGLYYLLDLVSITVLPLAVGTPRALAIVESLHLNLHTAISLLSLALVATGVMVVSFQRKRIESSIEASVAKAELATAGIMQSEARFRSLVATTQESVYCFELDPPVSTSLSVEEQIARGREALLVECNSVFAHELEKEQPSQVIGLAYGELDSAKDTDSHNQLYRTFIENGYSVKRYEQIYRTPEGEERALQISWTGVVSDGHLVRIWGAEKSILDLRQTRAELNRQQLFQQLVANISSRLLTIADDAIAEAIPRCLEQVGKFIDMDRISLVWIDSQKQSADLRFFWSQPGQAGPPPFSSSLELFPWMSKQTLKSQVLCIDNVDEMPEEAALDRESLRTLGLKSLAVIPLIVAGELVGAATFSKFHEYRKWSEQDHFELTTLAELFGHVLQKIDSRKALDHALADLRRATDRLTAENVYLRHEIQSGHDFSEILGESPGLMECLKQVGQVAETDTAVLILGETGTGKELIARAVHERSARRDRPLVKVNCAALPANLVESELFGYEKGAFTGAASRKRGRFDLANGGTLFLDEIGDFPLELQGKLLRVLQEGEFERLGGGKTIRVDVRLIAATNRQLSDAVDSGEFRADLFYRINTFPIELPPLRDRMGDVQILAEHFLEDYAKSLSREPPLISDAMLGQLNDYSWPGNVRELEGVIQRALISADGPMLELAEPLVRPLRQALQAPRARPASMVQLKGVEEEHIRDILEQSKWTISGASGAAARLGIPPSTLRSKMKKLGIQRPG